MISFESGQQVESYHARLGYSNQRLRRADEFEDLRLRLRRNRRECRAVEAETENDHSRPRSGKPSESLLAHNRAESGKVAQSVHLLVKCWDHDGLRGRDHGPLLHQTSGCEVSFPVTFTADNGTPLTVPSIGGSSKTITLGAGASTVIEAPNTGALRQGYVAPKTLDRRRRCCRCPGPILCWRPYLPCRRCQLGRSPGFTVLIQATADIGCKFPRL